MANNDSLQAQGVSTCYVFKSRLQEYAQKVGFLTPVYETTKEGPSHEPTFRSTVIVNGVRYDSLPGFFNRKAAEQSAAEVALMELSNCGQMKESLYQPVQETGLCKNLLQEYAQKMNFAIPLYKCERNEGSGKTASFTCSVEIGGIKYIGAAANNKKEAEIRAARTALLAIQSSGLGSNDKPVDYSAYTVVPFKKATDLGISNQETAAALKPKKVSFKKKYRKKKRDDSDSPHLVPGESAGGSAGVSEVKIMNNSEPESCVSSAASAQITELGGIPFTTSVAVLNPSSIVDSGNVCSTLLMINQNDCGTSNLEINYRGAGEFTGVASTECSTSLSEGEIDCRVDEREQQTTCVNSCR